MDVLIRDHVCYSLQCSGIHVILGSNPGHLYAKHALNLLSYLASPHILYKNEFQNVVNELS